MGFPNQQSGQRMMQGQAPEVPGVQTDERGREVQIMQSRQPDMLRGNPVGIIDDLWKKDLIDQKVWTDMYIAIVQTALASPSEAVDFGACADYADMAYFHWHAKRNKRHAG